ncbi:MAG: hypothetical protein ACLUMK_04150 [Christensenellales bacterium]
MRCFTPEYADGAALIDKVRARTVWAWRTGFYNYGLIPQSSGLVAALSRLSRLAERDHLRKSFKDENDAF